MARVDYKDMINFAEEVLEHHKLFEGLELVPLETYEGMDTEPAQEFNTPMATGFCRPYLIKGQNKIEKITVGELHYMRRARYCQLNMTATDDYDLPIYACESDEVAGRLSITIDFMPTVDVAVHEEYRKKYLAPLKNLWRKYRAVPGITEDGRCLVQRRYGPWPWARETLSPFSLDGNTTEKADRHTMIEAAVEYARVWLDLLRTAEPVKDPEYKEEIRARKKWMQKYYRERDPGGEVLKKVLGEEKAWLYVSLIF